MDKLKILVVDDESRMRKLEIRGVNYNKAAVACARELACFAWGMMTNHIQ